MCKLDLMDEAYYVLNSDAYGRLKYKKMMQQFMEEVEKMLPMLQEHPIINEIALRMGFYAYRMDDYERCKKYYEEYRRTRLLVSIEQYTPWMHVYLMVVSFVVRVLYILDTIRKLPSTNEVIREKASVRQNIQSFLIEPSEREYVILGRLLGFNNLVLLKRFMCKDEASGNEKAHVWFIFPDFEWEIDIAYNNITEDDETDRIFLYLVSIRWKMASQDFSVRKAHRKVWGFRWYRQVPLDWEIFQMKNRRRCLKSVICWRSICRKPVRRWRNWCGHMAM